MATYTLKDLLLYFLKLGATGFGGPVALVEYMHRDLVETRKWISNDDFKEGLALSQLAPGPLAAQLSIYIGYIHYGIGGATLTGVAFILPSFLMVLGIGWAYVEWEGLPILQAVFYGVGAAVIGIIARSCFKLTRKSIGKDVLHWVIFFCLAMATFWYEEESITLILFAGFASMIIKAPPTFRTTYSFLPSLLVQLQSITLDSQLWKIAFFFAKAGAFVFGSGLAIVPFLYGGIVKDYAWLNERQFLDAVAIAMVTPGPVVITVGFIGYLVAGFWGGVVAAMATFLPCYLFTIIPAPYFKKYGKHPAIKAFVDGVTAAAIGAIAGAVVVISTRTLVDTSTMLIAACTIGILMRFKNAKEPYLIISAALVGILLRAVVVSG